MALEKLEFDVMYKIGICRDSQFKFIKRIVFSMKRGEQIYFLEEYNNLQELIADINQLVWNLEHIADQLLLFIEEKES